MQGSKQGFKSSQRGISLIGLIVVLAVLGVAGIFAMKVFPTWLEYRSVKQGIASAKAAGGSTRTMQQAFEKNAEINAIESIHSTDLEFSRETGQTEISFAYQKKIPIAGNVSLLIDYSGTTAPNGAMPADAAPAK
jgi:type II secretory pathway pseudopilin PulG